MKKSFKILSSLIIVFAVITAFKYSEIKPELEIGAKIPMDNTKMMDVSGKEVALIDVKGKKGLLVIFSCNTCPYVKLSESRYKEVAATAKRNEVGVILINSNEAQRSDEDSFEAMKKYAAEQAYDFNYVVDKNSEVANAFGATRTPHVFLFDKDSKLVYRGAIDDNIKDASAAKEHYLIDALMCVGSDKPIKTSSTKSIGCSIKRVE